MLANLKLGRTYDGLIYLGDAARNPPFIRSHRHSELELNLVLQGSITYVIADRRYTFTRGSLLWIFPAQEHQMIDRSADARYYVAVFKRRLIENACRGPLYAELKSDSVDGDTALSKVVRPENFEVLRRLMDTLMDDAGPTRTCNQPRGGEALAMSRISATSTATPTPLNSGAALPAGLKLEVFPRRAPESRGGHAASSRASRRRCTLPRATERGRKAWGGWHSRFGSQQRPTWAGSFIDRSASRSNRYPQFHAPHPFHGHLHAARTQDHPGGRLCGGLRELRAILQGFCPELRPRPGSIFPGHPGFASTQESRVARRRVQGDKKR